MIKTKQKHLHSTIFKDIKTWTRSTWISCLMMRSQQVCKLQGELKECLHTHQRPHYAKGWKNGEWLLKPANSANICIPQNSWAMLCKTLEKTFWLQVTRFWGENHVTKENHNIVPIATCFRLEKEKRYLQISSPADLDEQNEIANSNSIFSSFQKSVRLNEGCFLFIFCSGWELDFEKKDLIICSRWDILICPLKGYGVLWKNHVLQIIEK